MKSPITFIIGLCVSLLSVYQLITTGETVRIVGLSIGVFFLLWGWKIGWTSRRNLTLVVGHIAMTLGSFVTAWSVYQIPFLESAPTLLQTLDMPLFWGIFTIWGGYCMITHGYCKCAIKSHEINNKIREVK